MTGLIGRKLGMTQFYNAEGNVVPATVVETGPCIVVQKKVATTDGYNALQVGFGSKKNQRVNKAAQGHMAKAGKGAFEVLREFRLEDVGPYEIGQEIKAGDLFKVGDRIDVSGTSKGHGFSGVIKRWSFGGFPGSHGTHEYFRHGGSIGNRSYPGRVRKGKKWLAIGEMKSYRRKILKSSRFGRRRICCSYAGRCRGRSAGLSFCAPQ